jgi:hypothetical protein
VALLETLTDNFDDNTISASWDAASGSGDSARVKEQNNRLEITHTAAAQYNELTSASTYDLTGSYALVQVTDAGNQSLASHEVILYVKIDGNNKIWISISGGLIAAFKNVGGVGSQIGSSLTYDSAVHAWLRIREFGGSCYLDTSADGYSWTNRWSLSNPFAMTSLKAAMQTGCYAPEASESHAYFDNFNIPTTAIQLAEVSNTRKIAQSVQVAWKKSFLSSIRFFTIGVSSIGGSDLIPGPAGVQSAWNKYTYVDESSHVMHLNYERGLNMPLGGLTKALADVRFENVGYTEGGSALVFDGGNDKVSVPGAIISSTTKITMYARVKVANGLDHQVIYNDRGVTSDSGTSLTLGVGSNPAGGSSVGQVFFYADKSGAARGIYSNRRIDDGNYHDIVVIANGTSGNPLAAGDFSMFIDGKSVSTVFKSVGSISWPVTGAGQQEVGHHQQWGYYLNGTLDSFVVWGNTVLSDSEAISCAYNNIPGIPTLRYDFNEGQGTAVSDLMGNYNGTASGSPVWVNGTQHSGRYTPYYAGGNSELFTAVGLPRRPIILNAGFNYGGIDNTIPQFVGVTDKPPKLDARSKTVDLSAVDFIGFLQNKYVDKTVMFTAERTDTVIANLLSQAGLGTSQYELDTGINIVKFGLFDTGTKMADIIDMLVKAEYGHFYQDEEGVLRFENRQHWSNYPHYNVQRIITTAQVINQALPAADHIINVVEVTGSPRAVQSTQLIWQLAGYAGGGTVVLPPGADTEVWANFNDPIFNIDTPVRNGTTNQTSFFAANTLTDGTGTDVTSSVYLKSLNNFAQTSKLVFHNSSSSQVYLTSLDIYGRPARKTGDVYYKGKAGASITAYEEQPLVIQNDYIQDPSWAASLAEMVLQDFANPENLQELTIRAMPELQLGDLISWQGRQWRIYDINTQIDPSVGFVQTLKLLQRTIVTYFRIGVSTIGGTDRIAP